MMRAHHKETAAETTAAKKYAVYLLERYKISRRIWYKNRRTEMRMSEPKTFEQFRRNVIFTRDAAIADRRRYNEILQLLSLPAAPVQPGAEIAVAT